MTFHRVALLTTLAAAALASACTTETMSTAPTAIAENEELSAARRGPGVRPWLGTVTIKGNAVKIDPVEGTMLIVDYDTPSPDVMPLPTLVKVLETTTIIVDGQPGKLGQIVPGYVTTVEGIWMSRWFHAYVVTANKG